MASLQLMLLQCNPFVHLYEQVCDIIRSTALPSYSLQLDFLQASDRNRYNAPRTHNELAAIIPGDVDTCINSRQIIVRAKDGPLSLLLLFDIRVFYCCVETCNSYCIVEIVLFALLQI
jgi:hypothetical protein